MFEVDPPRALLELIKRTADEGGAQRGRPPQAQARPCIARVKPPARPLYAPLLTGTLALYLLRWGILCLD